MRPTPAEPTRFDQAPAVRLQRLGRLLRYHLLRLLRPFELTPEQLQILGRLQEQDGRAQKDLVDPAFDDRANITHLVNQLERARLVERRQDDVDRRRRRVFLTERGQQRIDAVLDEAMAARADLFQGFSERELAQLMSWVDRLEERL